MRIRRRRARGRGPLHARSKRWPWLILVVVIVLLVPGLTLALLENPAPHTGQSQHLPPAARNSSMARVFPLLISQPLVVPTRHVNYLYGSGFGGQVNIPMWTFTKIGHWSKVYNPLPKIPSWAVPNEPVWSPDVRKVGATWVMWFSAFTRRQPRWDKQNPPPRCLGLATSSSPFGPFVSKETKPDICQWSEFGDIDPRTFVDSDGQEYLLWKSDDNAGVTPPGNTYKPTKLWSQQLASDGKTLEGAPVQILQNTQKWEGAVVEAPDMVLTGGRYYLFFSSVYSYTRRRVEGLGVAECQGPLGPCTDPDRGPWLGSNLNGQGPDEESVFQQNGSTWLLYSPQAIYFPFATPTLAVSRVAFGPGRPYVAVFDGAEPNP